MANVSKDLEGRGQQMQESYTRQLEGKQSPAGTALDTAGAVAGGIFDIAAEGVKSVNNALGGLPGKALTELPGPINSIKQLSQTPAGKEVATKAGEAYQSVKEAHPGGVQHAESALNIASILPVGMGAKAGTEVTGKALQMSGKGLQASAEATTQGSIKRFASELVRPEETKAVRTSEVGRTTEKGIGPFKSSVVAHTPSEARAAAEVEKIPGINPRATLQQNYNIIKDANVQEAQNLVRQVAQNDFIIPRREVVARMKNAHAALEDSPLIVGDAQKTAGKLLAGAKRIINENKGTASGLLKAKKDYDNWVLSQKPKAFDAAAENAFTIANREIRNVFKDVLDTNAPNAGVKSSLAKQSALYDAMDNIAPKAAYEANSAFGRALQRVGTILGTKNRVVQTIAAGVGIGGLGAASFFAPIVAGVGIPTYLVYRGGKLILNPRIRNAVGKLLETAGNVMNPAERQLLRDAYHDRLGSSTGSAEGSMGARSAGEPNTAINTSATAENTTNATKGSIESKSITPEAKVNTPITAKNIDKITLYHGATPETAAKIKAGGYKASTDFPGYGRVSLATDAETAKNYGGEILQTKIKPDAKVKVYNSMSEYSEAVEKKWTGNKPNGGGMAEEALNEPYDVIIINGDIAKGEKAGTLVLAKPEAIQ